MGGAVGTAVVVGTCVGELLGIELLGIALGELLGIALGELLGSSLGCKLVKMLGGVLVGSGEGAALWLSLHSIVPQSLSKKSRISPSST